MYRPLPDSITIGESKIEGLGLIAKEEIKSNILIGKIHIPNEKEPNGYFRTPLGAFGNHSIKPNCSKLLMDDGSWWIMSNQDIKIGDEYRVGPNGYFELIKSVEAGVAIENNT